MTKRRKIKKLTPPENRTQVVVDRARTEWDHLSLSKMPYISHVPVNPDKMTEDRKKRIKSVMYWYNRNVPTAEIAKKMGITATTVRRDLTAAVVLTSRNMPYVPKLEREIMTETKTFMKRTEGLMERIESTIDILEEDQKHTTDSKSVMAYSMLIGELRQTLELGAKLTGELQTGNKVNVIMFSGLVKKLIDIIHTEVDPTTFLRIRDRLRLELQGQQPLGSKGGDVSIELEEAQEPIMIEESNG